MGMFALVLLLVAYNNLLNLWRPFNDRLYVPANLVFSGLLLAVATWGFGLPAANVTGSGPIAPGVAVGAVLGAVLTAPLFAALAHPRTARRIADRRLEGVTGRAALYQILVRVPLGTALLEEVAFRGVLFAGLRHLGDLEAAVWSSLVFGLWHIAPTRNLVAANRPGASGAATAGAIAFSVVVTAAAGLGFAWIRLWTGTLWAPWALHASLNSLATLAALLAHGRAAPEPEVRWTEGVEI